MRYLNPERKLTINCPDSARNTKNTYDILYRYDFRDLGQALCDLYAGKAPEAPLEKRRVFIITDTNVAPLYADEVSASVADHCFRVTRLVLPAGEKYKNTETVNRIYEFLIENKADRSSVILALGGGVIGDMAGFAAATYVRGIDFVQIPTTLLAQADSSIGGKTGVDVGGYKNMAGAFYMPVLVYSNISTVRTLEKRQYLSGLAEVIKHGMILDKEYFEYLRENEEGLAGQDPELLLDALFRSNEIKKQVVEQDPYEKGIRKLLNFGHTIGHAIEKDSGFALFHGECVAIGCAGAILISENRGMITADERKEAVSFLESTGLPVRTAIPSADRILPLIKLDKKNSAGVLSFVLLQGIGNAVTCPDVSSAEITDALDYINCK